MNPARYEKIGRELNITPDQVEATALLLNEGATVPFIARYRKEVTGTLDEVAVTAIRDRLQQLTGIKISNRHSDRQAALVYFDRPEMSPILAKMNKESAEYKEALAIIQSGKEQLAARPRADMEGFVPSEQHRKMLEKYEERALQESKIHEAIREGKKVYDPGLSRR